MCVCVCVSVFTHSMCTHSVCLELRGELLGVYPSFPTSSRCDAPAADSEQPFHGKPGISPALLIFWVDDLSIVESRGDEATVPESISVFRPKNIYLI